MVSKNISAKITLEKFAPEIEKRLADFFDEEIKNSFGFNTKQSALSKELLIHAKEHCLRPGKRLRAALVYYGYLLSGKKINNDIWQVAMGVEIIHTALLMHDDFMDRDEMRRGKPTTHKYFEKKFSGDAHLGSSMAISLGDILLFIGAKLVSNVGNIQATNILLSNIIKTGFGQAFDISLEVQKNWTQEDIVSLHQTKTALYSFENPLILGALIGGINNPKILNILKDYAKNGGIAFQLQDDILGLFGNIEKTGKSSNSDLLQGKCTLLILYTLQNGTKSQIDTVKKVWGKQSANKSDLEAAKKAIIQSGSFAYSKEIAIEYATNAIKATKNLQKFKNLNPVAINFLIGIAKYLIERDI